MKSMKIRHTKIHNVLEIIALLILLVMIVYPVIMWNSIPDKIPGHYNAAGAIDRWGDKKELIVLPIIGVSIYLLLTVIIFFPSTWNMPVLVTKENKDKVYGCIKSMLILMKAEVMATFFYITYQVMQAKTLSPYFLLFDLIVIFGTMIYYIMRSIKVAKK